VHLVVLGGGVRTSGWFKSRRGRLAAGIGIVEDEEAALLSRATALGVADRVTLIPFTPDPGPVLRALDIVVFPNQGMGLGRPVIEAAAAGIPVIASGSNDGAGLLADGQGGILLQRGTPAALADAIARLVCDKGLRHRLGAAAAHRSSMFSAASSAAAVARMYVDTLRRR
jgi:phosphatidylinositol alpha-mannosyltransferase